jgi:serine/threonine-protein kinase
MATSDDHGTEVFQQTAVPLGATVVLVVSGGRPPAGTPSVVVPDVVGSAQADAQAAMRRSGLSPHSVVQPNGSLPRGAVVGQWPRPGDPAAVSGAAALLVSSGPPDDRMALVGVPSVIGHPEAGAAGMLERIGLQPAKVNVLSPTVPAGIVIAQLPEERAATPKRRRGPWPWILGALVALAAVLAVAVYATRSTTATVVVPSVIGLSQAEAKQALADAKLEAGTITERAGTDKSPGTVLSQDPAKDSKVDEGAKVDLVVAAKSELIVVPDVVGSRRDNAVSNLSAAGLEAAVTEAPDASVPAGSVVSQSPKAGQQVPAGTQVGITVSTGAAATTVDVPNVVGLPLTTATQKLGTAGLGATPFEDYSDTVAAGNVISQAPGAGTSVATGTPIAMIVSRGPAPTQTPEVKVPDVVGNTLADATTALEAAGLAVSGVKTDGSGKPADEVLYQTPGAGQTVPKGSQVVLVVSSGS